MKAEDLQDGKLIKFELAEGYRLNDSNGNIIGSTLDGGKHKLSLSNCQAIERGYDLDELADEYSDVFDAFTDDRFDAFKAGFKKAIELIGDKKFTEEDMRVAFSYGMDVYAEPNDWEKLTPYQKLNRHIQQTEWDVVIEMKNGCLILKRK